VVKQTEGANGVHLQGGSGTNPVAALLGSLLGLLPGSRPPQRARNARLREFFSVEKAAATAGSRALRAPPAPREREGRRVLVAAVPCTARRVGARRLAADELALSSAGSCTAPEISAGTSNVAEKVSVLIPAAGPRQLPDGP